MLEISSRAYVLACQYIDLGSFGLLSSHLQIFYINTDAALN